MTAPRADSDPCRALDRSVRIRSAGTSRRDASSSPRRHRRVVTAASSPSRRRRSSPIFALLSPRFLPALRGARGGAIERTRSNALALAAADGRLVLGPQVLDLPFEHALVDLARVRAAARVKLVVNKRTSEARWRAVGDMNTTRGGARDREGRFQRRRSEHSNQPVGVCSNDPRATEIAA